MTRLLNYPKPVDQLKLDSGETYNYYLDDETAFEAARITMKNFHLLSAEERQKVHVLEVGGFAKVVDNGTKFAGLYRVYAIT